MKKRILLIAVSAMGFSSSALADNPIGKISDLRGVVLLNRSGKRAPVRIGTTVNEGDVLSSDKLGSAQITLNDHSQVTISPESEILLEKNGKIQGEPSIVNLVRGQVRSQVAKKSPPDSRPKFYIRTNSATMGVRGTDFETVFNPATHMTSLVTFEGSVAMANGAQAGKTVEELSKTFQDPSKTVLCNPGQFSAVTSAGALPTLPVKISPAQFESLKNSSSISKTSSGSPNTAGPTPAKAFLSPVPPGLDAKAVTISLNETNLAIQKSVGASAKITSSPNGSGPPPEGFYDPKSGKMAPPAGGYVDLKTGVYVSPPPGSAFDPIAQVYVPPASMGTFKADTGTYVPPAGFTLDAQKGFVSTASSSNGQSATGSNGSPSGGGALSLAGGGTMLAAIPPPGAGPASLAGSPFTAPATQVITNQGTVAAPPASSGSQSGQYFNGGQPQFPVYDPSTSVCPPYCSPSSQPGSPGATSTTVRQTSVTFTIQ